RDRRRDAVAAHAGEQGRAAIGRHGHRSRQVRLQPADPGDTGAIRPGDVRDTADRRQRRVGTVAPRVDRAVAPDDLVPGGAGGVQTSHADLQELAVALAPRDVRDAVDRGEIRPRAVVVTRLVDRGDAADDLLPRGAGRVQAADADRVVVAVELVPRDV